MSLVEVSSLVLTRYNQTAFEEDISSLHEHFRFITSTNNTAPRCMKRAVTNLLADVSEHANTGLTRRHRLFPQRRAQGTKHIWHTGRNRDSMRLSEAIQYEDAAHLLRLFPLSCNDQCSWPLLNPCCHP